MNRKQLEDLLLNGPDGIKDLALSNGRIISARQRAEWTAITEVTNSYSNGEVMALQSLDVKQVPPRQRPAAHVGCRCDITPGTRPDGTLTWYWQTLADGHVCPICAELHLQDVGA
jgi:hypothetical protein